MNPKAIATSILLLSSALAPAAMAETATQESAVTEQEAHSIGVDAYVYLYPLVTMDLTRRQFTNVEPNREWGRGPMNAFANMPEFPPADFKGVVRPNFDTLYSVAWLDLTKEPIVLTVPDTGGRYYLLPLLDMWSDAFASPGWRTTGTQAGNFVVTPPGWRTDLRDKLVEKYKLPPGTQRIDAPTPYVWIIGRTKTDGPADYNAVHKIQAGFKLTPLSRWGKPPQNVVVKIDPAVDMETPPKVQVDRMPAAQFFAYAAEVLKLQPPHLTDQPIIARLKRIGFEPGKSFDLDKAAPAIRDGLLRAPKDGHKLMKWKLQSIGQVVNGWSMNTNTMGVYGDYYLKRAIVAQMGLGANLPEDAIYPLNLFDKTGKPLDGANVYSLHFDKAALPPVDAFWSVTLYDQDGFPVENELRRYALSSWMPLQYNSDGSLDLYFQSDSPGSDKESNWLPTPKGPFNLTMRLYAPRSEALTGVWDPPPVEQTASAAVEKPASPEPQSEEATPTEEPPPSVQTEEPAAAPEAPAQAEEPDTSEPPAQAEEPAPTKEGGADSKQ